MTRAHLACLGCVAAATLWVGSPAAVVSAQEPTTEEQADPIPFVVPEDPQPPWAGGTIQGLGEAIEAVAVVYYYAQSRTLGLLVPEYSLRSGPGGTDHGLSWELAYAFPGADMRHSVYGSIAYYPGPNRWGGRAGYRLRFLSVDLSSPLFGFHLSAGLGGYLHRARFGPRAEVRARLGTGPSHDMLAGDGLYVALAYEPDVDPFAHAAEISAGLIFPF